MLEKSANEWTGVLKSKLRASVFVLELVVTELAYVTNLFKS